MKLEVKLKYALKTKDEKIINQVFEEIYYEYGHLVGFVISKYISSKNDIEELINDVFLSFFNNLDKIKLQNIKAYLTKTAKNRAIDFLRKENNKKYILENEIVLASGDNDNSLYSILIRNMKQVLTDEEVNIVIDHVVYDMSFKVIAKNSNKPVSTISTKYYQAINKCKME